jgi:catechol 2,3-dioxygenase-like lactoylglutathione lyase family enzyme
MFTGVHHTALITRDLERTTHFWRDVLGLPLTQAIEAGGFKHYFFEVSATDCVAFFEFEGPLPEGIDYKGPGVRPEDGRQFDHLALGVADEEALALVQARLEDHGVHVRGPVDHGICRSIYFDDPNGISLEACAPT